MKKKNTITRTIEPTWDNVKKINDEIADLLPLKNKELIESVKMVATELIENAVKYCEPTQDTPDIVIELIINKDNIILKVSNGVKTNSNTHALIDNIEIINTSDNHTTLYINRIKEISENKNMNKCGLGLYRIAYEGSFNLEYLYSNNKVTIIAGRKL